MDAAEVPLPNFLIIGAQKSATRWLRINLGKHPDIYTAPAEPSYFNLRWEQGPDWYRTQFPDWSGERFVGEATPGYMILRQKPDEVAARIDRDLPDVRLLALLRNPVDRLYSAFVHHMRRGRIATDADLLDRVGQVDPPFDPQQLVAGGLYAASLEPYLQTFGDRLRVFLHDDLLDDPARIYGEALRHIGAPETYRPEDLEDVVFSRRPLEGSSYMGEDGGKRQLTEDERQQLFRYFESDVQRLEELLGRDLSLWRPRPHSQDDPARSGDPAWGGDRSA
jgi:Sulfotransferase domain